MIIHGIMRTKGGNKKLVQVAGYTGPDDLTAARDTIRQEYSYAKTILFLIPKEEKPA